MKFTAKKAGRILSALLAAAMIVTSTPQTMLTTHAAEIGDTDAPPTVITDATPSATLDTATPDADETPEANDTDTPAANLSEDTETPDESPLPLEADDPTGKEGNVASTDEGDSTNSKVEVTFNLSGHGDSIAPLEVDSGSKLENSEALQPTAEGFRFDGWYKNAELTEQWDFDTDIVTDNITLYAKWTPLTIYFTVSFELSGHGDTIAPQKVVAESKLDKATLQPTAEGFQFEGWYKDAAFTQPWDFDKDTVTQDITLYAKWQEVAPGTHVVTFNLSGHGNDFFQYPTSGSTLEKPDDPLPDVECYRFLGWYKESNYVTEWNFEQDTVTANITLYAKWEEITYTVTFDFSGIGTGTNITRSEIKYGSLLTQTEELTPTAEGYLFLGWYKDADYTQVWDFTKDTVTENITLYAHWKKTHTVTFNLSGKGADIVKTNIFDGDLIPKTEDLKPTADGFHFENWYKDPEFKQVWNLDKDTVTSDLTLYAKWETLKENQYIVTYNLSEHGADFYDYVDQGSKLTRPDDPTDEGWLFLNWYIDEEYQKAWDFEHDTVDSNLTLYAKWAQLTSLQVGTISPVPFTGKPIKPSVSVYYSVYDEEGEETRTALKANKDYKVSYHNNVNTNVSVLNAESREDGDILTGGSNSTGEEGVGGFNPSLPYIFIEGKGNYSGRLYMNFEITQVSISDEEGNIAAGFTLKCNDQFPLGKPKKDQKTISSLKYKVAMKEGTDYTAEITGAEAAGSVISKDDPIFDKDAGGGDCTLTITGIGNYTGTIVKPIIVRANNTLLKNAKISLGSKCKSKPLDEEGVTLIPAWYEVVEEEQYDKNGDPIEDAEGNIKVKKKTVYKQYIDGEWVDCLWVYNEKKDEDVKRKLDKSNAFTVKVGNKWLQYGEDYDISYANNTSVGTATMTIKGTGEYTGSKSINFKITKTSGGGGKAFNADTVKVSGWVSKMSYTGSEQTQSELSLVSSKWHWEYDDPDDKANSDKWKEYDHVFEEDEYTVTYTNNIRVGTATATFTANPESGYSGSFKKTFKITPINMAEFVTFVGENESLEPNVIDEDVEVDTGKTDEDGEPIMKEKHIHKVIATRYMEETTIPYVKSGATLNFNLTSGISEEPLVLNRDYTISYKNHTKVTPLKKTKVYEEDEDDDGNIKNVWTGDYEYNVDRTKMGALVIKGKGNYSGTVTIKYQIVKGIMDTEGAIVTVARSAYDPKTKEYKPKVTVWTPNAGTLSSGEFSVKYSNNKKDAVTEYLNNGGEAPTVTVTLKKNGNYENLSDIKDEDGNTDKYEPIALAPVTMEFYSNKLTAKNLYIIIDNENPKELVYTGKQVTNVRARVYYGSDAAVKAAKKAKVTNHRLLTDEEGSYGLVLLTEAVADEEGTYSDGEYTVTYGKNTAVGKNKGSITINGCGAYGGSVSQKFTIYQNPVYYNVVVAE